MAQKDKELKIVPPEGYEIDKENSTFECIKFKPKITYEDVAFNLFSKSGCCFIDDCGRIEITGSCKYSNPNCGVSIKQLEKLLAINKLMNVSKYLNGDWKPDWNDEREHKFYIGVEERGIYVNDTDTNNESVCYFKCPGLAQEAVDILGEDTIYLIFSTDW